MDKIIFWGGTGQALVLHELLADRDIKVVAVFDNNPERESPLPGVPLYHGIEGLIKWEAEQKSLQNISFLAAIGGTSGNARMEVGNMLEKRGYRPFTAVHREAFIAADAVIGKSCQVLAKAAVCARAVVGDHCILNTGASVDHGCILHTGVHVSAGAVLAGNVTLHENVFVGINATLLPNISVGANAIIGAGAVVLKDVPAGEVHAGNPARRIK